MSGSKASAVGSASRSMSGSASPGTGPVETEVIESGVLEMLGVCLDRYNFDSNNGDVVDGKDKSSEA